MHQAQLAKHTFSIYGAATRARQPFAFACRSALLTLLDRLHLYSAPIIVSAECLPDGKALLSGNSHMQG